MRAIIQNPRVWKKHQDLRFQKPASFSTSDTMHAHRKCMLAWCCTMPDCAEPHRDALFVRDFKDAVYLFFESDTLFLESCSCFLCVVFSCLAILRIEGCLNRTVLSESILGIP